MQQVLEAKTCLLQGSLNAGNDGVDFLERGTSDDHYTTRPIPALSIQAYR
jgi:hypothetical protein